MFKRQEEKNLYFSTKVELKIDNVIYRPSICYPVPTLAKKSLEQHAAEGRVTFYNTRVRFVNGAIASMPVEQTTAVPSVVSSVEESKPAKRRGK